MKHLLLFMVAISFCGHSQNVYDAAREGDTIALLKCYQLNADTINSSNDHGFTPLILATYRNQVECVKWLINKGANVNLSSPEGIALHGACFKGNTDIARILIDAGSNVNTIGARGSTALIYAVWTDNIALVKLLLEHGSNKDHIDESGTSARGYALRSKNEELISLFE